MLRYVFMEEVDELISWLTGYDAEGIISAGERSVREFFDEVPALNTNRSGYGASSPFVAAVKGEPPPRQ